MNAEDRYEVSVGKTLLGNWVEERHVAPLDSGCKSVKKLHIKGHDNILTHPKGHGQFLTTCNATYQHPKVPSIRTTGRRQELMERELCEKLSIDLDEQFNPKAPPTDYTSTTKKDFTREFEQKVIHPTTEHDIPHEQPMTFWKQNMQAIYSAKKLEEGTNSFQKNSAFSTPIDEQFDAQKPGDDWCF